MDASWSYLIAIVLLLGVAAMAYVSWLREKKRREAMRALADEFGWRFDPHSDTLHDNEYAHFEIFRRGHRRAAFNTLTGAVQVNGRPYAAKMGDFRYKITTGSGKNRRTRTYRFSYLIVQMPFLGVPDLLIRREGVLDKLAGFVGFNDIDFESAEFSRRFHVQSPERKFAYDVIHPRMMEFLLKTDPSVIDIERSRMCLSDGRTRWPVENFKQQIDWMQQFFAHWPRHVTVALDQGAGLSDYSAPARAD